MSRLIDDYLQAYADPRASRRPFGTVERGYREKTVPTSVGWPRTGFGGQIHALINPPVGVVLTAMLLPTGWDDRRAVRPSPCLLEEEVSATRATAERKPSNGSATERSTDQMYSRS